MATVNFYSKEQTDTLLSTKANRSELPSIVQTTGSSTTAVMSQKAVTDALSGLSGANIIKRTSATVQQLKDDLTAIGGVAFLSAALYTGPDGKNGGFSGFVDANGYCYGGGYIYDGGYYPITDPVYVNVAGTSTLRIFHSSTYGSTSQSYTDFTTSRSINYILVY